jgi:hypothetical protein
MQKPITSFVGLDVHQDSIAVAVAPTGSEEPRFVGTVAPQWAPLCKAHERVERLTEAEARAARTRAHASGGRSTHESARHRPDRRHDAGG